MFFGKYVPLNPFPTFLVYLYDNTLWTRTLFNPRKTRIQRLCIYAFTVASILSSIAISQFVLADQLRYKEVQKETAENHKRQKAERDAEEKRRREEKAEWQKKTGMPDNSQDQEKEEDRGQDEEPVQDNHTKEKIILIVVPSVFSLIINTFADMFLRTVKSFIVICFCFKPRGYDYADFSAIFFSVLTAVLIATLVLGGEYNYSYAEVAIAFGTTILMDFVKTFIFYFYEWYKSKPAKDEEWFTFADYRRCNWHYPHPNLKAIQPVKFCFLERKPQPEIVREPCKYGYNAEDAVKPTEEDDSTNIAMA